jgi:hypothetical protein
MPTGGAVFPVGSTLQPVGDVNGDQGDELALAAPRIPGTVRDVFLFDLRTDVDACAQGLAGAQCTPQYLQFEQDLGQFMGYADGNQDHLVDAWLLDDSAKLYAVYYSPDSLDSTYSKVSLGQFPDYGPLAVLDVDLDGSPEVQIAGPEVWWRFRGRSHLGDDELFWERYPVDTTHVRESMIGPFSLVDFDADADTIDIVGFSIEYGDTHLHTLRWVRGEPRASLVGTVVVDDAGTIPDDLAVCGSSAWVVVAGRVKRIAFTDPASPTVAASAGTTASRVDCGSGPSGATGAYLHSGDVVLVDNALDELDRQAAPGAEDLAIGDLGAGPRVETCATAGCTIVHWPYGATGDAVFARGDATDIVTVDATGAEVSIGGRGQLTVADLDADGNVDLLGLYGAYDLVSLHRSTGASIAPVELWHGNHGWQTPLAVLDGDGDGEPDLWAIESTGDLRFTQPQRDEPTTTTTTPGSTGDTGGTGDTGAQSR